MSDLSPVDWIRLVKDVIDISKATYAVGRATVRKTQRFLITREHFRDVTLRINISTTRPVFPPEPADPDPQWQVAVQALRNAKVKFSRDLRTFIRA